MGSSKKDEEECKGLFLCRSAGFHWFRSTEENWYELAIFGWYHCFLGYSQSLDSAPDGSADLNVEQLSPSA
jgi:hypothetical protein